MEDQIYNICKLDKLKRRAMLRYFSRLCEQDCIEAIRLAYSLSKQHMQQADDNFKGTPEFFYAMICLSIAKMEWARGALGKKNKTLTDKQVLEISQRRVSSILSARKDRCKRGRLSTLVDVKFYHLIDSLRSQNLSWRECAMYMKRYHKTSISHVHLREIFLKITEEKNERGEK